MYTRQWNLATFIMRKIILLTFYTNNRAALAASGAFNTFTASADNTTRKYCNALWIRLQKLINSKVIQDIKIFKYYLFLADLK